jgi:hypothetical protein
VSLTFCAINVFLFGITISYRAAKIKNIQIPQNS